MTQTFTATDYNDSDITLGTVTADTVDDFLAAYIAEGLLNADTSDDPEVERAGIRERAERLADQIKRGDDAASDEGLGIAFRTGNEL